MDRLRPWQQRRRRAGSRHAAAPGRHARGGDLAGRPRDSTCRRPPVLAARAGRGRGLQSAGPPSAGTAGFVHRRLAGHRPGAGRPAPPPLRTTDGAAACAAPQPGARAVRGRPFGPAGRHRAICPWPCAHAWRCAPRRAPHPEPADTQARPVHRCRARCRRYRLVGRPGRPLPQRGCQRLAGWPARRRSASARQPQGQLWRCGRDRW